MADKPRIGVEHPRLNPPHWTPVGESYGDLFPNRINVVRRQEDPDDANPWEVWRGSDEILKTHPTHAEAIAYAQKIARQA